MSQPNDPICIHCGQASRTDRFNRLADGRQCPACAERLLANLPALLPGGLAHEEPLMSVEREPALDLDDDIPA